MSVSLANSGEQAMEQARRRLLAAAPSAAWHPGPGALDGWRGSQTSGPVAAPVTVLRSARREDVPAILKWANEKRVPLSTFSSGPGPHARGMTATEPTVLLDLSGLRAVRHVDGRDAMAIIEPGVTFAALDAQLAPHGLRAYRPLMPRGNKSVIASMLEREPILNVTEQWDVLDPFGACEIVFGNGESFRTGAAAIKGSVDEHHQAGLRYLTAYGPASVDFLRVLQGAQGTLGVVTWAAVMCERIPAVERAVFITDHSPARLAQLLAWVHWRRMGNAAFMANGLQFASMVERSGAAIAALAERLPPWAVWLRIGQGGSEFPREQLDCELEELQAQAAALGLAVSTELAGLPAESIARVQGAEQDDVYQDRLAGAHRTTFCLHQLDHAEALVQAAQAVLTQHRWPADRLAVVVQPRLQGRNAHIEFVLPHTPAEAAQAERLGLAIAEALQAQGALFSRPYGAWSPMAYARQLALQPYLRQAKTLLDPARILNPGRLCY